MSGMTISVGDWLSADHGPDVERHTTAFVSIQVNDTCVTRVEDTWSKSSQSSVRLSLYPLAHWFASSWWRLRWEPVPQQQFTLPMDWRLSHEMGSAGGGYLWPPLVFESDGVNMEVAVKALEDSPADAVRYVLPLTGRRTHTIPAAAFEREIDVFMGAVLARLGAVHPSGSPLAETWAEVLEERHHPQLARYRALEARLGFDPDGGPEAVVGALASMVDQAGEDGACEIAAACAGQGCAQRLEGLQAAAAARGVLAKVEIPALAGLETRASSATRPWEQGRVAARWVRQALGLDSDPLVTHQLAGCLGVTAKALLEAQGAALAPAGLGVRLGEQKVKLIFQKSKRVTSRRFEAARLLADHLFTGADTWLVAADIKTARQKAQRAFAAELLCPISHLNTFLADRAWSEDAREDAAAHFEVSTHTVTSQLLNHGLLSQESVNDQG